MATTKEYPTIESYDLAYAYIAPLWLRIELHDDRVVFRQCHFYVVSESNLDLFRVAPSGKMERFSIINSVDSVDEVSGPPEVEPAPVGVLEQIPVVMSAPGKIVDDEIPFVGEI